jgi:hypothetical protein
MTRLLFSVGLVLAVCAGGWPGRGHTQETQSAAAEDVACAERVRAAEIRARAAEERAANAEMRADAAEARAKAKTKPRRKATRKRGKGSASGISPETMRRLDDLLLLDAIRGAGR